MPLEIKSNTYLWRKMQEKVNRKLNMKIIFEKYFSIKKMKMLIISWPGHIQHYLVGWPTISVCLGWQNLLEHMTSSPKTESSKKTGMNRSLEYLDVFLRPLPRMCLCQGCSFPGRPNSSFTKPLESLPHSTVSAPLGSLAILVDYFSTHWSLNVPVIHIYMCVCLNTHTYIHTQRYICTCVCIFCLSNQICL